MAEQEKNKATGVLDDATNTSNPTDVNSTYQTTTVNDTGDTVIKDAYANKDKSGYASAPNTTTEATNSKTGSGLKAPEVIVGTDENGNPIKEKINYSWETKAEERAKLDYESSVLETKSNMLQNRQDLESKGQQFQDQFAMQQYKQNQSIDKVGWTGGYVLDSERQVNYLKQTIQAQMYGQMELQKYGYDTSLAAARLAYDTNRYDLALEYYNTALSRAVSEAEITGYYIAPETNEMLDQYSIASQTLNDPNAREEDRLRADKILASVYEWFEGHGISKNGVETYKHLVEERTHKLSIDQIYKWINDDKNQISTDTFAKLDENGNKIYKEDGSGVETINFSKMTAEDIIDYIYSGPKDSEGNKTINTTAQQQYLSRLDSIAYEMENSFKTWCSSQDYLTKEDGSLDNSKDYISAFNDYIKSSEFTDKIAKEINRILPAGSSEDTINKVKDLIENWSVEIELPNGQIKQLKTFTENNYTNKEVNLVEEGTKPITIIDKDGTTKEADVNYLKQANNITDLMQGLSNEQTKPLLDMILNIDFSSEKAFAESFANWQQYAKLSDGSNIPFVSSFLNMINTATDATSISYLTELISDQANADKYKNQANLLTGIKQGFNDILGKENIQLITDAANRYNKLSEKDKSNMMTTKTKEDGTTEKVPNAELTALQNSAKIIAQLNSIDKAINYAESHDSGIFTEPWDYIADSWKTTAENWNDGYQFGDVTRTTFNAIENIGTTIGSAIIGGVKWLFSWL